MIISPSYKLDLCDLSRQVDVVSEDFTLLDLVQIVRDAEAAHPGLAAAFGMPCVDAFYEEAIRDRSPGDDDCLSHLELYWGFDYDIESIPEARRRNRRRPKGKRREIATREIPDRIGVWSLMGFHGIGRDPNNSYAIWLTPLNDLARLPIRVNARCVVCRPPLAAFCHPVRRAAARLGRIGATLLRWWDRRAGMPVMTIEMRPTLHTFISSVLEELTFAGPHPTDREAQSKELDDACESAKMGELTDMDDLLDEFDDELDLFDDELDK